MPDTRLQSDMMRNMSRAERAAMMQRGLIAVNQGRWVDYARARNESAFYEDSDYDYGVGSYQRYYAQQQSRQAEFQRQRFLNAQKFQNQHMLQQQKSQDIQLAEEREQDQNEQDLKRQLDYNSKEIDALENHPEMDKNHWTYKERMQQLLDDRYKLETGLNRNTPQKHQVDSGFTKTVIDPETGDSKEEPIMSEFWFKPDGTTEWIIKGGDVAEHNLAKAKQKALDIHNARTANHNADVLEQKKFSDDTARQESKSKRMEAESKASGAVDSTEMYKEKMKIRDEVRKERLEANNLAKVEAMKTWTEANSNATDDEKMQARRNIALEHELNDDVEVQEINDRYDRRQLLREPELTPEQGQTTVQYEQPDDSMYQEEMEPEFSDEQFAGTEPAGLYDPTGQPLPMDGGMYNGYA